MNKSAIDKGLFRAQALKKYFETIKKNPASSQTGLFMKPDRNKVDNMKDANYEKLSEEGYTKLETVVKDGDVIIGMVNPKPSSKEDEKPYKDNSMIYKSIIPGAVDKVITGLNNDGYPIIKIRIRSERIPEVGDKFSCYDDKTEVLTDKGWIKFEKLTKEHQVATLVDGKKLVYENPSKIQTYDYDGEMYYVHSEQVNLCVTPNHKMWVASRGTNGGKTKNYKLEKAEDIIGLRRFYQKNVTETENKKYGKFRLGCTDKLEEIEIPMKPWLTFMGIWFAEGCLKADWAVQISAHKPRVKAAIDEACKELGVEIRKRYEKKNDTEKNAWFITDKRYVQFFEKYNVGAINKTLPKWVWKLSMEHCRILINAMCLGDGYKVSKTTDTWRYCTSSWKLRNDFQRLCLHAGWSANYIIKCKKGSERIMKQTGQIIRSNTDHYNLTIVTKQNNPKVNKNKIKSDEMIDYQGQVYCCTVTSGVIYVRRNGIPCWSGNSRSAQKGDTLTQIALVISKVWLVCKYAGNTFKLRG